MSISRSKRPARGLARFLVPALALLFFLSPIIPTPAESAGGPPYHLYLPLTQSNADLTVRWSTPFQIDLTGLPSAKQINPVVELDDVGNAYAIWRKDGPLVCNYFSHWPAGQEAPWSIPERLHDTELPQGNASMTTDPQGNLYVLWDEQGGPFLLRRSPSGAWSQPEAIAVPKESNNFDLAADPRGRLHLLYTFDQGGSGAAVDLFYLLRDETGAWHPAQRVNDRPGSLTWKYGWPIGKPSLAVDGAGIAHAAWREVDNRYNWQIFYSQRQPDGSWSRNEVVEPASGDNSPSLAADAKGNVYVAFFRKGDGPGQVRFAYHPAGGQWLPSVQINASARDPRWTQYAGPSLQIDGHGAVYVIWPANEVDGVTQIYFDWRGPVADDAGNPSLWHDDETIVETYGAQAQDLAANGRGDLIAVWFQYSVEPASAPKIYSATRP